MRIRFRHPRHRQACHRANENRVATMLGMMVWRCQERSGDTARQAQRKQQDGQNGETRGAQVMKTHESGF